jgi:6-phosphogluconolactonase (cycloisomerase 2 family)
MGIAGNGRGRSGGKVLGCMAALALGIFGLSPVQRLWLLGSPQLVSIQEIPEMGYSCFRPSEDFSVASRQEPSLLTAFQTTPVYAQDNLGTEDVTRPPARNIRDTAPTFSSVGVDAVRNEVYLQDSNRWSIRVFSRLDNAKPGEPPTEPRRVISGPTSDVQFNSCVWVDPGSGDIYTVENDTGDSIVVFANRATGDAEPLRKLKVTHRAQSMTIDDATGELFLSVQYPPQVAVYSKTASGDAKPIRLIEGPKTRFSDVHGIAIDTKNKLLYVNNWGNVSDYKVAGSGHFEPPSISVYPTTADGDTAPLRVIQGAKTQLDWPGAMSVDPDIGDLYVANDMGQSILVFRRTDRGDVAPARVVKGPRTHLSYPAGVFVDARNKELWASNLGNSTATVYPLTSDGDVAPLRMIRGAEENKQSLKFGKTEALAYDSKREQILVPN